MKLKTCLYTILLTSFYSLLLAQPNLIREKGIRWNVDSSRWEPSFRFEYHYDDNNLRTQKDRYYQYFRNGEKTSDITYYFYNDLGLLDSIQKYNYFEFGGAYIRLETFFTYDSDNCLVLEEEFSHGDPRSSTPPDFQKNEYAYSDSCILKSHIREGKTGGAPIGLGHFFDKYDYSWNSAHDTRDIEHSEMVYRQFTSKWRLRTNTTEKYDEEGRLTEIWVKSHHEDWYNQLMQYYYAPDNQYETILYYEAPIEDTQLVKVRLDSTFRKYNDAGQIVEEQFFMFHFNPNNESQQLSLSRTDRYKYYCDELLKEHEQEIFSTASSYKHTIVFYDYDSSEDCDEINNQPEVSIYPNPANNVIQIKSPLLGEADVEISVLNLAGRELNRYHTDRRSEFFEMDISKLPRGTYVVQVQNRNGRGGAKLIVW